MVTGKTLVLCLACIIGFASGQTIPSPACKALQGALFDDIGSKTNISGHYYLTRGRLFNYDAKDACAAIGANLVEFESREKFNIVVECITDRILNFEHIHIGGEVDTTTGLTTSSSSNDILYTDWHSGEVAKLEDSCAALYRRHANVGVKMVGTKCLGNLGRALCEI